MCYDRSVSVVRVPLGIINGSSSLVADHWDFYLGSRTREHSNFCHGSRSMDSLSRPVGAIQI